MQFRDFNSYTKELGEQIRIHRYTRYYKYPVGVVVFRVQPVHVAHVFLASQALLECEKVYCIIGSANKHSMLRNPLTYEFREFLLKGALEESGWDKEDIARVHISGLKDWSTEDNAADNEWWGRYLYCNIVNLTGQDSFAIYYSDDLDMIRSWFTDPIFRIDAENPRVNIRHFVRNDLFDGLSATKVREALMSGNSEGLLYLVRYCPKIVIQHLEMIQEILHRIKNQPQADTSIMGG